MDGVYAGRPQSSSLNLQNIDRVEVLKGPQGTLFGKNTIAGAVNIITKKTGEELEGKLSLNVGNLNKLDFRAL
ncbi:MAG: TonB-dependent receptor plug domain-containing protein [Emcibacter sp.]|nr:TonB-dependent receptor plug domain-containing protein [Emcibacter sp.]